MAAQHLLSNECADSQVGGMIRHLPRLYRYVAIQMGTSTGTDG